MGIRDRWSDVSTMEKAEAVYENYSNRLKAREDDHLAPPEVLEALGITQATYERWMEDVPY